VYFAPSESHVQSPNQRHVFTDQRRRSVPFAQSEFKNIISDLLKIPTGLDLPQERVMSMWRNADKDGWKVNEWRINGINGRMAYKWLKDGW
jgi:hypothetical protein